MKWTISSGPAFLASCAAALLLSASALAYDQKAKGDADKTKAKAEYSERESGKYAKKTREGATDTPITMAVKSRLMMSPATAGLDIKVEAEGDVVTLRGEVASDEAREQAELIAMNTHGVETVRNRLEVNSGGD